MYYTELDPRTMKPVYVCKNPHEKAMQRALIQYRNPANYDLVYEALMKAGRQDLIGFDKKCLIRPRKMAGAAGQGYGKGGQGKAGQGAGKNGQGKGNQGAGKNGFGGKKSESAKTKKKTIRNVHKKKTK
jgi:hypothetical protein